MTFDLKPLPYAVGALEPYMSARTLTLHHGKHVRGYVDTLNKLLESRADLRDKPIEEIIHATAGKDADAPIFNNAAQVWNHEFFFRAMKAGGGGKPDGDVAAMIDQSFGSYDKFTAAFVETAMKRFGSGWVWLVLDKDKLSVISTPNAADPVSERKVALLGCDVWEHAYYLDYENRRQEFVEKFLQHLVNWAFAGECLTRNRSLRAA